MKTIPQAATIRYVGSLIKRGKNSHFQVTTITQRYALNDEIVVGQFYTAAVQRNANGESQVAAGVTPNQAVQRALEKFGVTFR